MERHDGAAVDVRHGTRRAWLGLVVLALPTMLLSLDLSALFLALPHLSAELGATNTQQLWITDIYVFLTAGFLITMGRVGDRIGRRRLLLLGAPTFAAASVLAAYATTPEMLILARGLLGVAGASLLPSALALLRTMFPDPQRFSIAIAGWTTAYMAGIALGPIVGGALLERYWWGAVFLLGVPVMLVLLVAGPMVLPEAREPEAGRIDLPSVGLSLVAILPIVYGLKEFATRGGGGGQPWLALAVGLTASVLFLRRQRRVTSPVLDLALFHIRTIRATLVVAVLMAAVQSGTTLLVTQHLQLIEGFGSLETGLWLALPSLTLVATITLTPPLAARLRPGLIVAGGLLVAAIGQGVLTQTSRWGFVGLMTAIVIVHAGIGPVGALINQLILGAAPQERAGSAAGLASTSGEFGIALGVAVFGSLAAATYRRVVALPDAVTDDPALSDSLVAAMERAGSLGEQVRGDAVAAAMEAFVESLSVVATTAAALFVGLGVLAMTALRHVRPTAEQSSSG